MSYGVDRKRGSYPTLLCPWCRPAATALIRPLAWEPPYAMGAAQENGKKTKTKNKQKKKLFEPALWNPGKVIEAEAYSLKTRNGSHRKACAQKPHRTLLKVLFSYSDFGKVISNHFILVKGFQNLYVYAKIACTFSKKETLPQVKGSSKE